MGRRRSGRKFAIRRAIAIAAGNPKRVSVSNSWPQSELKISRIQTLCKYWWNNNSEPIVEVDSRNPPLPRVISIETIVHRIYVVTGDPPNIRLLGGSPQAETPECLGHPVDVGNTPAVPAIPERHPQPADAD